jgi:hypothetical protein
MSGVAHTLNYDGTDHWVELTADDSVQGPHKRVIMDTGAKFVDATVGAEGELLEVHSEGMEIRATPRYNRTEVETLLSANFNGCLSAEQISALLDWYEDLVAVLIEMEIYDYDETETCVCNGTCFTAGMAWESLRDEIADVIETRDARIVPALAVQVNDWWRTGGLSDEEVPDGDVGMVADIALV